MKALQFIAPNFKRLTTQVGVGVLTFATMVPGLKAQGRTAQDDDKGQRAPISDDATRTLVKVGITGMPEQPHGWKRLGHGLLRGPQFVIDKVGWTWGVAEIGLERGLHLKLHPLQAYVECLGPDGRICRSSRIDMLPPELRRQLLEEHHITGVVNFQREAPDGDVPLRALGIDTLSVPVIDSQHPSVAQMLEVLNFVEVHGPIDQHCKDGVGRTGVGVTISDVLYNGTPVNIALKDKHNRLQPNQMRFVLKFLAMVERGEIQLQLNVDRTGTWVQVDALH